MDEIIGSLSTEVRGSDESSSFNKISGVTSNVTHYTTFNKFGNCVPTVYIRTALKEILGIRQVI